MDPSSNPLSEGGVAWARSPRSVLEPWIPRSDTDKAIVLAQLELLLAHPLFFQSKRYPALLRFVVEQSLAGNSDQVKERSIGMDVFGRPPGYDANADPVVRVTAGEIRKRLAQYYYDPTHIEELRIELPTGSYVPVFQRSVVSEPAESPAETRSPEPPTPLSPPPILASLANGAPTSSESSQPDLTILHTPHPIAHLALIILLIVFALALGLIGGYWYHRYLISSAPRPSQEPGIQELDDFWRPMTVGQATVTFCLGEPARDSSGDDDPAKAINHGKLTEPLYFRLRQSGLFALADVVTLTRMAEPLQKRHKAFRISAASEASFGQLREGPAVLIGAYDNLWTMRLTRDLRFGFESIDGDARIIDRKSKSKATWAMAWDQPYVRLARDYAIVARYRDAMTGQPLVIAAGISEEGTEAAGELISNPAYLTALLRNAPPNWRNMNMEAVIETQVIDGNAGPPQILAVEFW